MWKKEVLSFLSDHAGWLFLFLSFLFLHSKDTFNNRIIVRVKHIGSCRLHKLWVFFWASPSCLYYIVNEKLAFSPWMWPREIKADVWVMRWYQVYGPWTQCLQPRFIICLCRFMAIADLEGCHSKCHQCSYLFIKTSPWSNCSSNHQQKKERVMKSVFGYIAGVRTYWGLAAIVSSLTGGEQGTESKVLSKEQRVPGDNLCWSLLRQFLNISVGWEPKPFLQ